VLEILGDALRLYARYPVLFAVLAVAVVVPYELIVLGVAGSEAFGGHYVGAGEVVVLNLFDALLLTSLISALHIHAVAVIGDGGRPRLLDVAKRGVRVLPVVFAAQLVAGLGIAVGFVLLIVPGVILMIRWAVVAQAAAIENVDWLGALRRSGELTRRSYLHAFGLLLVIGVVGIGLERAAIAVSSGPVNAPQVLLVIAVVTISRSFAALTTAILFFDLSARASRVTANV
jgi:hypothetical protein